MNSVLLAIDIILAVFLTILVLLQRSEGGALGALGGGSGNSLFTGRQAGNMLTRLTWWTFVLFIVTNLGLVILAKQATTAESIQLVPTEVQTTVDLDAMSKQIPADQPIDVPADEQKPTE